MRSTANSAGICRRATISASMSATAGPRRARPPRHPACACRTDAKTPLPSAGCARPPTALPMCCARTASSAATASPSCCRRRRKSRLAHMAIYKLGAVALPIAVLFGPDALGYRLQNSGARALITNAQGVAKLERDSQRGARPCPACLSHRRRRRRRSRVSPICSRAPRPISRRSTPRPTIRRMMIYTSGTTGQPKGALHGHRVLLGHLPGAELPHYPFPQARRPLLDAGRLGLGRRPARRAAAEPASRRAGGRAQVRQVRSGRRLRADGSEPACATPSSRRPRCA